MKFRHKKSLGQHFLKDANIVRKIAKIAEISPNEKVWEIGPGSGVLTEELLKYDCDLTCFEIDKNLYPLLENRFGDKINLVKQDILKTDWQKYFSNEKIKIVANLPYQITSPFLFTTAKYAENFSKMVVMIQKEVAERISAKVGTKSYGRLTLKMQFYFDVEYGFTIKPNAFYPPPKIDSSIIILTPRKEMPKLQNAEKFWQIVEVAFKNRRKMLRRNFREIFTKEEIEKLSEKFDLTRRGETFTEIEFIELYEYICS